MHNYYVFDNLTADEIIEDALKNRQFYDLWNGIIPKGRDKLWVEKKLLMNLSHWCNCDEKLIDSIFRKSKLFDDEWDSMVKDNTYGEIAIKEAINKIKSIKLEQLEDFFKKNDAYETYPHNDIGTSRLFADFYKGILRFVPERKSWYFYDGIRWRRDINDSFAKERCKELVDALLEYSYDFKNEEYKKYCRRLQTKNARANILYDAQSVYPMSAGKLDSNKYLFNCQNGTLDLKNNIFRKHDPNDWITKLAPVKFNPNAVDERFSTFINEIMSGDKEKAKFLQKVLGYALSGETQFECMFILYGATTRNGKGTLMESTLNIVGDYGKAVRPETLAEKSHTNSSGPSEDIARLAGVRFANISEPSKSLIINAAQVKTMTGNDTINARFLRENSFDFKPQFKVYINSNYLPVVNDTTVFSSNRIYVIPFDKHFSVKEQDRNLKVQFATENSKSAILNWLINGYVLLQKEGLQPPQSVLDATNEYAESSNKIKQFVEECLTYSIGAKTRTSEIYCKYKEWCSVNGMFPESIRSFNQSLRTIGKVERGRPNGSSNKTTIFVDYYINNT